MNFFINYTDNIKTCYCKPTTGLCAYNAVRERERERERENQSSSYEDNLSFSCPKKVFLYTLYYIVDEIIHSISAVFSYLFVNFQTFLHYFVGRFFYIISFCESEKLKLINYGIIL